MRILVSAYACEPGKGSEPGVGWNFVKEMSSRHVLTVLTRANNRRTIEDCGEPWIGRVRWIWYDPPKWLTFWKRGGRGVQLFYILWQWFVARHVRRRLRPEDFDLIHHITFGKYWIPSFLGFFGPPLVFGPVGGGDETPRVFRKAYSIRGRFSEWKKTVAERFFPIVFRRAYQSVSLAIAATDETAGKLRRLVRCPVVVHPQSAISIDEAATMRNIAGATVKPSAPRFVTACRLEHWKAVDIAIRAFPEVLRAIPEAKLTILGKGPEEKRLRRLVRRLGLDANVTFAGRLPALEDVYRTIAGSTALIHPALHESFGQVCLEAVALGTPVVCWNHGGPGLIAKRCGLAAVPIPDKAANLSSISHAMSQSVSSRSPTFPPEFLWLRWCEEMDRHYQSVTKKESDGNNRPT